MKLLRFLARLFGWLLTPLVASAASFFGAVGGSWLAARVENPTSGLILSTACALGAAVVVTIFWLKWLRGSPVAREVLGVDETGTPDTFMPDLPQEGEAGEAERAVRETAAGRHEDPPS